MFNDELYCGLPYVRVVQVDAAYARKTLGGVHHLQCCAHLPLAQGGTQDQIPPQGLVISTLSCAS